MLVAMCTIDGSAYEARDFYALPDSEISRLRRALVCPDPKCGRKAFYRTRSRDGRAPCFGSNDHTSECELGASDTMHRGGDEGHDEAEIINVGERLVIDLDPHGQVEVHEDPDADDDGTQTPRRGRYGEAGARRAVSRRRLRPILRDLVLVPAYRLSHQLVSVPGFDELPIRDFFVRIENATPERHQGQRRGYWGTIVRAAQDRNGDLWFNSGSPEDLSLVLPAPQVPQFWNDFPFTDVEDIAGASILALGEYKISAAGKPYVRIDSAHQYTMRAFHG